MNVKLFTHIDLDGIGCGIIGNLAFENIDIEYCNYNDINEKVQEFIKNNRDNFDKVFITDISVNEETADMIHKNYQEDSELFLNHFVLLDHHPTALWLNKYSWCKIQIEDNLEKTCGTEIFYDLLKKNDCIKYNETLDTFVEKVKRYDTWLWKEKYNDKTPKVLNDLFYIYGKERFIENMIYKIKNNRGLLSISDFDVINLEQDRIDRYIKSKSEKIIIKELKLDRVYKFGIVTGEQHISEMGNRLAEENPDLDFIAIVNFNTVSLRTVKDDVNVGIIAKHFKGGGHPKASGFSYKINLNDIFNI